MSKNLFTNPKTALGFAGVTIAIAVAASFGASAFFPAVEPEPEPVVEQVAEGESAPAAGPAPAVSWGEDDLTDDWSSEASNNTSGEGGWNVSNEAAKAEQPDFGGYAPDSDAASSGPVRSARAGSSSGPRVQSRAAPGAPPVSPPGGGPKPLTQE